MEKKNAPVILNVEHLKQYFNITKKDAVKAVDDISFHIFKGETFGLVGESGSGKTTTGRAIIRLYEPTAGKITFEDEDVSKLKSKAQLQKFRRDIQMIFQDPYASLNPRMKVRDIIAEGIDINHLAKDENDRNQQVDELLQTVGLSKEHATRYPHEFSGGQRQRIGIARALAVKPKFIIADEPISALDVSIQAQVVNLLKKLQNERDLTFLFIAHDLSMVKYISDRIGVMHYGKMLEIADSDELYAHPLHDYTRSLLSSVPFPDPEYERNRKVIDYDDAEEHDGKERSMVEIAPGHFVSASEDEIPKYQQRLNESPLFDD
ncbi:ATP-binding cassette domain-containing protein [Nicoliella spurrieriana]|uniref:ATP-binding cassette domain-containing protein n=1 Tax=Nicoliella spurrieriana TaxID=2925830 RepID=A0A976RR49_9LACO|nr:ATP-binding cassette domain-containing protein [Nicoliella spurrieriana]UQS86314.1 ATP-binding cassette domain-containing protein [Nicoliella spurrieriana]